MTDIIEVESKRSIHLIMNCILHKAINRDDLYYTNYDVISNCVPLALSFSMSLGRISTSCFTLFAGI